MKGDRTDVDQIKERIDIASVISRYVTLTKAGSSYKGRCPFHKDDTPSFWVSPDKGLWHCFGCSEGGDLFAFLMKIEKLSFPEAVERLAAEAGVTLSKRTDNVREDLFAINIEVARWFEKNLTNSAGGRRGREYLINRGYPEETWERFGLGYAPAGGHSLQKRFAGKYGTKALVDLGLLIERDDGSAYDRFRDRVIFPIFDLSNRPIAFGGRAFAGDPKYLNSPKTRLFDKSGQLYGLSWTRDTLREKKMAVLVEGYTDVISLHLAGITNAVGSMGTSLTHGQADLLGRFAEEVVISYDRDLAGGMASLRGMSILRNRGLSVRVARLPQGEDPDSLVRRDGAEEMLKAVDAAIPFHMFYIESLKERHDTASITGKEAILKETRSFYQEIATRLAEILDLPPDALAQELSRGRSSADAREPRQQQATDEKKRHWDPQQVILSLILHGHVTWDRVAAHVSADDFSPQYRPMVAALSETRGPVDTSSLVTGLDEETLQQMSYLALAEPQYNDVERALQDALTRLVELPEIEKELARIRVEIESAEKVGDHHAIDDLQRAYSMLVAKRLSRRRRDGKTQTAGQGQARADNAH